MLEIIHKIQSLDIYINTHISLFHGRVLNSVMLFITNLVSVEFVCFLFFLLLIALEKKSDVVYFMCCSFVTIMINLIIKLIVHRARPDGIVLAIESGYSFPSAHAMLSTFIYGFISYLIYINRNAKKRAKIDVFLFVTLVILIGFSRIYIGVHYFSDVICGAVLGLICLVIFIKYVYKPKLLHRLFRKEVDDGGE